MPQIELTSTGNSDFLKMKTSQLKGDAKWKDIEDLINRWAKRQPKKAIEHEQYLREVRQNFVGNKYGYIDDGTSSSGNKRNASSGGTRISVSVPDELMQYIEAFYPKFLETKEELHEFKKRFPKFCILQGDIL